jgi:hypothetical protein
MPERQPIRARPRACPWANYPTHSRNRELQVSGERPLVYGYCPQEVGCASCAGTLYQPNLRIEQGRSFIFVECPFCRAEEYRKRVARLKPKLPVGSGPTETPLDPPKEAPKKAPRVRRRPPPKR